MDPALVLDERQVSPSSERNRGPILEVLQRLIPAGASVLEIASGSGMHAAWFSAHLDVSAWQPTDPSPRAQRSIAAWRRHSGGAAMRDPLPLDVTSDMWPVDRVDIVFNANMIHISPWAAALGLLDGAARVLGPGGQLVMYGPYRRHGVPTAPSNERFDASLKSRDPTWGLRDLEVVVAEAASRGLTHVETVEMPANNLIVAYRRG